MINKFNARLALKRTAMFFLSGLILMWITFWYLSGSPLGLVRFLFVYYVTDTFYMEKIDKATIFEGALKGIVNSVGEPHSQYLDPKEFRSIKDQTESAYSGVGIVMGLNKEKRPVVVSAIEDQPAALAGIKTDDIILSVDDNDTASMSLEETSAMVRGKEGTVVHLTVQRGKENLNFTLERKKIILPTVRGKMLNDHIGYIRIVQFADQTGTDFATTYKDLKAKGMTKLVVDLRNNPGGLLTAAEGVANYILPKGPFVSIKERTGTVATYNSAGMFEPIPLTILVNGGSASASEIIAGAVQDEKAGIVIGTKTYGKGTVQTIIPGPAKDAVKVTIAKYHTPADRVIDGTGIIPDMVVELPENGQSEADDTQLQTAIQVLSKEN